MKDIEVIKRDGSRELLDYEKIHKVLMWAVENVTGVSASEIELKAHLNLYDGIKTTEIHDTLISAARDLICEETPNYDKVAGRLEIFNIRKEVYKDFTPCPFLDIVKKNIDRGFYDPTLLDEFSEEEINELGEYIVHDRDYNFRYAGTQQLVSKYLAQDRTSGRHFESPQVMYMLISMTMYMYDYDGNDIVKSHFTKKQRLKIIKEFYDDISLFKTGLPTPVLAGARTPTRQYSSCVVIETADDLDSLGHTNVGIMRYISKKAGLGLNLGRVRPEGSSIRNGEIKHTGLIPFIKASRAAVKSCSQGGLRGGSATMHFPLWHTDIENLIVLKNNKGTEETRERHLDYSVGISGYFLERMIRGQDITLLPPNLDGLYDAYYEDPKKFKELYEFYEKSEVVNVKMKKKVPANELFRKLLTEGKNTGRVYIHVVDEMNRHTPFDREHDPIHQSNLCVTGDTKILTDKGYEVISSLVNEDVNVWNGQEWSNTTVRQTSEASNIVTVTTDSGYELDCTLYHKFYVKEGKKVKKVEAHELKRGDKLIKFELPVIEGNKNLEHAYDNGFFSGDGCYDRGRNKLFLYDKKQTLINEFTSVTNWSSEPNYNRTVGYPKGIMEKFFIPDSSYTIESRLKWLSGYIDADGYNHNNGLCVVSTNKSFLKELQLMLQTLGVSSKVKKYVDSGKYELPANNGTGEKSFYECADGYRLLISSYDTYQLLNLGLELKRVDIHKREPNRDAKRHVTIESVINEGRVEPTFCFTEEKRNMGMFNGILTSQCQEIALPTRPFYSTDDESGRIALCTLANSNFGEFSSPQTMKHPLRRIVRALDNLLSMQDYPMVQAKLSTEEFRPLGIGVNNLAYFLAKNGVSYSDPNALPLVHNWMEHMSYYMQEASIDLAKERGACTRSQFTKRAKGVMLVDTYKKKVDELVKNDLELDWDKLREDAKVYGVRNATLSATMPSESNSQVMNATNGVEPIRNLITVKKNRDKRLPIVVPSFQKLKNKYELLWDIKSNKGYLDILAVIQKFTDQAISVNLSYNPNHYENNEIPMSVLMGDMLYSYALGHKTRYYINTNDEVTEFREVDPEEKTIVSEESQELEEDHCESCVL